MKKSLIALAVLAGTSGIAAAQSSVTLSGTVDLGLRRVDGVNSMGGSGSSRNNITFSGTEDLGNGNSAFFTLNHRFNLQNGTQNGQNSAAGTAAVTNGATIDAAPQFYRNSFVGLKNVNFGDVRLGRILFPLQELSGQYDPWYGGDTVGSTHTGGLKANLRANSSAYLRSASFAGLTVHLASGRKDGGGTQGGNVAAATAPAVGAVSNVKAPAGAGIQYVAGPLSVALATDTDGSSLKTNGAYASYDAGVAKVYFQYESGEINVAKQKDTRFSLSAGIPFGAVTAKVGYLSADDKSKVGKTSKLGVGAEYALSKRTAVYSNIGKLGGDEQTTANKKARFDVGVQHKF